VLSYDEMPEDLRAERDRWDANRNGVIEFEEFTAYAKAKMASGGVNGAGGDAAEEHKRPTVYTAANIAQIQGLPQWFIQLDTDKDGQVGLYEWKAGGRSLDEFQKYDLNGDGFITVEEVMRVLKIQPGQNGTAVAGGPGGAPQFPQGGVGTLNFGGPGQWQGGPGQGQGAGNRGGPGNRGGGNGGNQGGGGRRGPRPGG
jgi:hypothetical protein